LKQEGKQKDVQSWVKKDSEKYSIELVANNAETIIALNKNIPIDL
jgi:hypothetical protein